MESHFIKECPDSKNLSPTIYKLGKYWTAYIKITATCLFLFCLPQVSPNKEIADTIMGRNFKKWNKIEPIPLLPRLHVVYHIYCQIRDTNYSTVIKYRYTE